MLNSIKPNNYRLASLLLWIALVGTLLPYRFNKTGDPFSAYTYPIAILLVVTTGLFFLLSSYDRHLVITVAKRSPHFFIYFIIILISQTVNTMQYTKLEIADYVWTSGYVVMGIVSYFIFAISIGNRIFKQWLYFFLIVGGISSAIGIYSAITGARQILNLQIRQVQSYAAFGISTTSSIFYESNRFAIVAFFGFLAALYFIAKRKRILLGLIVLLMCVGGIFVSWSRSVYLALIISFIVWLIIKVRKSRRFMLVIALGVVAVGGMAIMFSVENVRGAFFGHGWAGRDQIWPVAIGMILNRPLWGYGFGRWEEVTSQMIYTFTGMEFEVHSTPLCVGMSAGIFAVIFYFIIIIISLRRLHRSSLTRLEKATIAAGVVGMFISGLFLEYDLGGASFGSFVQTIFLGLANASPWLRQRTKSVLELR